jgi:hypothetical protein
MKLTKVAISVLFFILLSGYIYAADFYVQQTVGDDANPGDGWGAGHALATIESAVELAGGSPGFDWIRVAAGTYDGPLYLNSSTLAPEGGQVYLMGGYPADTGVGEQVPCDPEANLTIIDGHEDDSTVWIYEVEDVGVYGFVIRNGRSAAYGGGINAAASSHISISRNQIQDNYAYAGGGGISLGLVSEGLVIQNTIGPDNTADGDGGGILVGDDCEDVIIVNNTITGNSADNGGGIMVVGVICRIEHNTIENNQAATDGGGIRAGYFTGGQESLIIKQNDITSNDCAGYGGGIDIEDWVGVMIDTCTITENGADTGGGISFRDSIGLVLRSIITGNDSANEGSGVQVEGTSHLPQIGSAWPPTWPMCCNCIHDNVGEFQLFYDGGAMYRIYAINNYWGTTDPNVIRSLLGPDDGRSVSWFPYLDACTGFSSSPMTYTPGGSSGNDISVYNPGYPGRGDIEVRLDLTKWPSGWEAKLSETKIAFDENELSRDVTLTMASSPDAKPGDSGTLGVSVWVPGENEPLRSFPVVFEVPILSERYAGIPAPLPYPAGKPVDYEIPFYNPYYPASKEIELRLDLTNWPSGWTAELSQTQIKFNENELSHNVTLTVASSPDAKPADSGTLDISVWLPDENVLLETVSVAGEVTAEAARTLSITSAKVPPGNSAVVYLSITDAAGVAGGDILVKYDTYVLEVGDVELTDLTSDMHLSVNKDVAGEVKLAMAQKEGIPSGSGYLVKIELTVREDAKVGTETTLELDVDTQIYDESNAVISLIGENGLVTVLQSGVKGDVNNDGRIRANDAILALRISAELISPTEYQQWAADVNGDGGIASDDAVLILDKATGLAAPVRGVIASAAGPVTVTLAEAHGTAGQSIRVPVKVDSTYGLAGGDICVTYDSTVLRAVDVSSYPGVLLASNTAQPGMVRIAFAADRLDSETLAEIQFDILADKTSPLKLQRVKLYGPNALPLSSRSIDRIFTSWAMPAEQDALLQNFPNPFNPETWIPYQLREGSEITIRIYSASGELVRELDLGYRSAGFYVSRDRAAYWDGRNKRGEQVASGVYFYSIRADDFSAVRKLTALK